MYKRIGGMKGIDRIVDDFYYIMATDPLASECFKTHEGKDIKESGEKLKAFLSGWTGGPQLYLEKYGHPRLRMRHFPFQIGSKEGEQWLYCMKRALEKSSVKSEAQSELMTAFTQIVKMISENRP
jgi:hemoglobin